MYLGVAVYCHRGITCIKFWRTHVITVEKTLVGDWCPMDTKLL